MEIILKNLGLEGGQKRIKKSDLAVIEYLTGIRLTTRMKDFLCDLSQFKDYSGHDKSVMMIDAIKPASSKPFFSLGNRRDAVVGNLIDELIEGKDSYKSYVESLDDALGIIKSWGVKGKFSELYPMPLFDSYSDGHVLICIDHKGRVVEFNYELDENDCSILANGQDEFLDNLYIYENQ